MPSGSMEVGSVRFVLQFEHVAFGFCREPSTFVFEKNVILCKNSIDSE